MAMIFPGMDPYLEEPHFWPGIHNVLIVYIAELLKCGLSERYIPTIEVRTYLETSRLEIKESYLAILDREAEQRAATVLEVVSPANKLPGNGRDAYLAHQQEVLSSNTNLVELDLLRTGEHTVAVPESSARTTQPYQYIVCVCRAERKHFELYMSDIRRRLPRFRIPLAIGERDSVLDLQVAFARAYENGCYRDVLNYDAPCVPPLSLDDQAWASERIQQAQQAP